MSDFDKMIDISDYEEEMSDIEYNSEEYSSEYNVSTIINENHKVEIDNNIEYNSDEYSSEYDIRNEYEGIYLFSDKYKQKIPGYILFRDDEIKKNESITSPQIYYNWIKLKHENPEKYNEYVSKYEKSKK